MCTLLKDRQSICSWSKIRFFLFAKMIVKRWFLVQFQVELYMHYDASQENQPKESFVELQDSMVKELRAIARLSQDMVGILIHLPFWEF